MTRAFDFAGTALFASPRWVAKFIEAIRAALAIIGTALLVLFALAVVGFCIIVFGFLILAVLGAWA